MLADAASSSGRLEGGSPRCPVNPLKPPARSHEIRVALVGVGNCASSLVQGVEFYKDAADTEEVPGLMHVRFGDYHVGDLNFVAAFDVDEAKVGLDLSEAIIAGGENNTFHIADVPTTGGSPSSAATPWTAWAATTARPSPSPPPNRSMSSRPSRMPGSTS